MNDAHIGAIISAGAGITGVLLGNAFVAIKEWWKDHKKDDRDSTYLAILVVSHLDRFASGCCSVAMDDGTSEGRPAGENGSHQATVTPPEFSPLEIDVEWKVLPKDLMYEILQIPDRRERLQSRLSGIAEFDFPPDYTEYFWARRRDYAELGLHVSAIAKRLREHAGMPIELPAEGEWNREAAMQEVIDRIDALRADQEKRNLALVAAL
ncbi:MULTISPECIES: hypothetical protein [unclassified Comamonas]|uniref:hypothetical protein n=1 Tax=unclassified Comamonas TaxID=2638500 RepID=UPI001FA72B45|nr:MULTISPECIES: hypothetical protein [unclassified Comamonas]UNV91809.1 hypothetical protein MP576_05490 [Comamonas sp. 7D-2evo1]UNV94890.1 hypothetical protein MPZ60_20850 [Comamonas sp. 7D-2]UNW01447.1 hypothetical protein MP579_05475 [Comamonas sp. 7D-2evo2]